MKIPAPTRILAWTLALALLTLAGALGYRMARNDVAADIYRERLDHLVADYQALRDTYNQAVRRSAVTELVVERGRLSVRVRTDAGVVRDIPTPFDPAGEIYVDYVVVDGRLWIRRVFDDRTPPWQAVVIDPEFAAVDWAAPGVAYGKAVYRRLAEGRWIVTVTGDGSLGLAPAPPNTNLVRAPQVRDYAELPTEADDNVRRIGPLAVWSRLLGLD